MSFSYQRRLIEDAAPMTPTKSGGGAKNEQQLQESAREQIEHPSPDSGSSSFNNHRFTANAHLNLAGGAMRPRSLIDPLISQEAQLAQLATQLDTQYKVEADSRLRAFLAKHNDGHISKQIEEEFKANETIEHARFLEHKNVQLAKFARQFCGSSNDTSVSSPAGSRQVSRSKDLFKLQPQFPPPRNSSSRRNGSSDGLSFGSMSSSNSRGDRYVSGGDGNMSSYGQHGQGSGSGGNSSDVHFNSDQIYQMMSTLNNKIEEAVTRDQALQAQISRLENVIGALYGGENMLSVANRIGNLEQEVAKLRNGVPLESDAALVANLESAVAKLRLELDDVKDNGGGGMSAAQRVKSETELTTMSLNAKCGLIEKYLGIDITTTGPKPHGVLEGLHRRLWHLENFLPQNDPELKSDAAYKSFNDFMQKTLGKGNTMVNYSATPGYYDSSVSDTASVYGGGAPLLEYGNRVNSGPQHPASISSLNTASPFNVQAEPFKSAQPPTGPAAGVGAGAPLHGYPAWQHQNFHPADVRYRGSSISKSNESILNASFANGNKMGGGNIGGNTNTYGVGGAATSSFRPNPTLDTNNGPWKEIGGWEVPGGWQPFGGPTSFTGGAAGGAAPNDTKAGGGYAADGDAKAAKVAKQTELRGLGGGQFTFQLKDFPAPPVPTTRESFVTGTAGKAVPTAGEGDGGDPLATPKASEFNVKSPPASASKDRQVSGSSTNSSPQKKSPVKEGAKKEDEAPRSKGEAYNRWLNQRPGQFLGKKLAGLEQTKKDDGAGEKKDGA